MKPFETELVNNLEIMNEVFTILMMYLVICLNEDVAPQEYGRAWVGNFFIALVFLNVFLNFYFLFRTVFRDKVDKQVAKGDKASLCCVYCCWPLSRKLNLMRKRRIKKSHKK